MIPKPFSGSTVDHSGVCLWDDAGRDAGECAGRGLAFYPSGDRFHARITVHMLCTPDAYSLPAVPFVMFFDKEISLHGTYWHDGFGYEHSHGCVNMSISDAHWLYDWVGGNSLTVVVWNSHHPAS